jgi:hypothetical protein
LFLVFIFLSIINKMKTTLNQDSVDWNFGSCWHFEFD